MRGVFITFEGLDGSGKTTQIGKLDEYLSNAGYEVVLTIEPGGTSIGESIRGILLDPENTGMSDKAELLLFEASRAELVSKIIRPAVESGRIVICDRFFDSTIVYQGIARNLGIEKVYDMSLWATSGIEPDLTFLLSLDVVSSENRLESLKKKRDRIEHEEVEFKKKLQEGYLEIAKKFSGRFVVIDASLEVDQIFEQISSRVDRLLEERGL